MFNKQPVKMENWVLTRTLEIIRFRINPEKFQIKFYYIDEKSLKNKVSVFKLF